MAKGESKVGTGYDATQAHRVALDDIPDRMPILAPGRWAVQFVRSDIRTITTKNGPATVANIKLDPVEPVSVDHPNADYSELRQEHTLWLNRTSDLIAAKKFFAAFGVTGVDLIVRDESGATVYPAFEAAKGQIARATATETIAKGGRNKGNPEVVFTDFATA